MHSYHPFTWLLWAMLIQLSCLAAPTQTSTMFSKRDVAGDMATYVENCVKTIPNMNGDFDQLQVSIRNCSLQAFAMALQVEPNSATLQASYDALKEVQRQESTLSPTDCPITNVFRAMHPVQVFWEEPILPCYSKLQTCVANAKKEKDTKTIFSDITLCMAHAHTCRAEALEGMGRILQVQAGRKMADQYVKLYLAFASGNQTCKSGESQCVTSTRCGRYLIPILYSMDTDSRPPNVPLKSESRRKRR